ncbi:MAG: GNAT family N-acetyltransferase [Gaiellaceae bacterium]
MSSQSTLQIDRGRRLQELAGEWDALVDRLGAPPWVRPGWISAWWGSYGAEGLEPIAVRRAGELVGLAPVVRARGRVSSPTNWHSPSFTLLAADPVAGRALVEALFEGTPRRVSVGFLPTDDPSLADLRSTAAVRGYRARERFLQRSPYVELAGSLEQYLAGLDRHQVKETLRRRRRLAGLGELTFSVEDGRVGLDRLLAEGLLVEASGWKGEQGTAIQSRPETLRLYGDVARWAAGRGSLRLAFLRLDGRAIAFELALEEGGVVYAIKAGFDVEFRRFGPGALITYEQIARAFALGLRRYELLGSDEPYKLVWAREARDHVAFDGFAPSVAGRLEWVGETYGRRIAGRARTLLRR